MLGSEPRRALEQCLARAQAHGAFGPGSVAAHIDHALALAAATPAPSTLLDLGSGGGVPGLPLALVWPKARVTLLDAQNRRVRDLLEAVSTLGLTPRVQVVRGRAEQIGRDPQHREQYELVVSRSFGGPAVTAECGAPFVQVGGALVVSEPPEKRLQRWPEAELEALGLGPARPLVVGTAYVSMTKHRASGDDQPRSDGRPAKAPLWAS